MKHCCRVKAGSCNRIPGMFDKLRQDQMAGRAMDSSAYVLPTFYSLKVQAHVSNNQSNDVQGQ